MVGAHQTRNRGDLTFNIYIGATHQNQFPAGIKIIGAYASGVGTQTGAFLRQRLDNVKASNLTAGVAFDLRLQLGNPRLQQPNLTPLLQIASAGVLQFPQEIGQSSIGIFVAGEIATQSR